MKNKGEKGQTGVKVAGNDTQRIEKKQGPGGCWGMEPKSPLEKKAVGRQRHRKSSIGGGTTKKMGQCQQTNGRDQKGGISVVQVNKKKRPKGGVRGVANQTGGGQLGRGTGRTFHIEVKLTALQAKKRLGIKEG